MTVKEIQELICYINNKKRDTEKNIEDLKFLSVFDNHFLDPYNEYNEYLTEQKDILMHILKENINNISTVNDIIDIGNYNIDALQESNIFYSANKMSNKNPAIMIKIDDEDSRGESFFKDPYFGVYDAYSFGKAKSMVRVSIFIKDDIYYARLLNHKNIGMKGKLKHMPSNSDQLKYLNTLMDMKCNNGDYVGMKIKDAIREYLKNKISLTNYSQQKKYELIDFISNQPMADFSSFIDERNKRLINR